MTMPFWDSVSTHSSARTVTRPSSSRSTISSTCTSTACGTSWRVRCRTCSRTSSASRTCSGWSETSSSGNRNGPSGANETRCSSSGPTPLPVRAEIGNTSASRPRSEAACSAATVRDAVEPVDLVDGDDGRDARAAQRLDDEAVARPADALLAVEQEQHGVGLGELVLDALLHALGERVARALDAREVGQHELPRVRPFRVRRDAADRPPGGLRLVGDDRDLLAHERVDERRLADVGPPRQRDEAGAGHLIQETISACRASISPLSVS